MNVLIGEQQNDGSDYDEMDDPYTRKIVAKRVFIQAHDPCKQKSTIKTIRAYASNNRFNTTQRSDFSVRSISPKKEAPKVAGVPSVRKHKKNAFYD